MAVSAGGRFALSPAGAAGLSTDRSSRHVMFGNKLNCKPTQLHHRGATATTSIAKVTRQRIRMSLAADVAGESKEEELVPAFTLSQSAEPNLLGINKVYILTQFNSASLNRHLARAYTLGNGANFGDGYVEVLAATQTPGEAGKNWFQGTADAVRQFHWLFEDPRSKDIEDVLILSGDHLYRMDYMDFVQNHRQSGADITISCLPMDDSRASDFGLMKIDNKGRVLFFSEKPKGADLKAMEVDTTVLGLSKDEAAKKPYIASMGVYVFKKEILLNLLRWRFPTANDFGSEIIPASAREFYIQAFLFNDYWEDIGTIRSFFKANLALTEHPPRFSFYDAAKPMYTSRRNLPPSKIDNSKHSVVGIRSRINSNVHLKDTVMLGADYYETDDEVASLLAEGRVPIGIGENTRIRECIIDKNAKIGKNNQSMRSQVRMNVVCENFEGLEFKFESQS
ncbi:conserved fungal protein Adg2 [Turnera subulata]|uniref:glucose-1-phosphate adenylyltransferase n=1 Tax=Turnera subulata TaxID=218843 RepID=A0A9Q0JNE8_9ROSI|nr:conserved fungal protein Adg2 [Turnera subulata]